MADKTHPLLEISRALLTHIESNGQFELIGNMPYSGKLSEKPSFIDVILMFRGEHGVKVVMELLDENQLKCLGVRKAVSDAKD